MDFPYGDETRDLIRRQCADFMRQASMEPAVRLKPAAVAITLVATGEGDTALLLTVRAASLRSHGGQWALPGGRCDAGETAIAAALRELQEELGLAAAADDVLGILDDYPTRSGYLITPVVVWPSDPKALVLNPEEVASVHLIPLAGLVRDAAFDFVSIAESERRVIRFRRDEGFIHAPTAALIYQFGELLAGRHTRVADLEQPVFAWR